MILVVEQQVPDNTPPQANTSPSLSHMFLHTYSGSSHIRNGWAQHYFRYVKIASFPGPAQLFVSISTEKRERAWYLFSRE